MKVRTIRQTAVFSAPPHEVFETLMDSRRHSRFTGGKASISRKVGGRYSVYDGYIHGVNVELVQDERIVQTWQPDEDCWPKEHYSQVKFDLCASGKGTRMRFTQTGVPVRCGRQFDIGWKEHYWKPMRELLKMK